jgi:hypothetical protein
MGSLRQIPAVLGAVALFPELLLLQPPEYG